MANPTTNYGFVLPEPTDLVTNLPADFDVALQGVDTQLKALQPGTTLGDLAYSSATANTNLRLGVGTNGQVLAVVAGEPAWANAADQTPLTTKGDLFTFSTVDARLPVGTNGQVLTADSATATGLKFANPAATGASWSLLGSVATTSGTTVTLSGLSGFDKLYFMFAGISFTASGAAVRVTFNSDTGSNYINVGFGNVATTTYNEFLQGINFNQQTAANIYLFEPGGAGNNNSGNILMSGCNQTGFKQYQSMAAGHGNPGLQQYLNGIYKGTSVISTVTLTTSTALTFDAGTLFVYGSN